MTFFQNPQPPEENAGIPPAKNQPLFKQDSGLPDSLSGQHISLSAYISKHLKESATEPEAPPPKASSAKKTFWNPSRHAPQKAAAGTMGQYINNLDVEMGAGLEQYLPTLSFRLRVVKKRLDGEIAELKNQIGLYERLPQPSPDIQDRLTSLRSRLMMLQRHEQKVRQQLSTAMSVGHWWYQLNSNSRQLGERLSKPFRQAQQLLVQIIYGQAFLAREAASQDLRDLQELFARRLKDQSLSSEELSQLLTRYEHGVYEIEKSNPPDPPFSFPRRLWQQAFRLVK